MKRDSISGTFLVATILCVVCSVLVSTAAVSLRETQNEQKQLYRKKNILIAAGLAEADAQPAEVDRIFAERVEPKVIDLDTGKAVSESVIDPNTYDPRAAAKDPQRSDPVEPEGALPGIRTREKYAVVYEVKKDGQLDQIVLPIYGKGLWSTLYGFLSLDSDTTTVRGITYYEHAETPGLGGEVENPRWTAIWREGKEVFDDDWDVAIEVIKGAVNDASPDAKYQVDGLSGATITTKGVSAMVQYWVGPDGFGKYLERIRTGK